MFYDKDDLLIDSFISLYEKGFDVEVVFEENEELVSR